MSFSLAQAVDLVDLSIQNIYLRGLEGTGWLSNTGKERSQKEYEDYNLRRLERYKQQDRDLKMVSVALYILLVLVMVLVKLHGN